MPNCKGFKKWRAENAENAGQRKFRQEKIQSDLLRNHRAEAFVGVVGDEA